MMIEEISPSGKFKTVIIDKNDTYSVEVYIKREEYITEYDISFEYWSRITKGPTIVDSKLSADIVALEHIRNNLGEPSKNVDLNWIKDYTNSQYVECLDDNLYEVFFERHINGEIILEEITAIDIFCINNKHIVIIDDDGCYLVGNKDNESKITCWYYVEGLTEGLDVYSKAGAETASNRLFQTLR
jgi:hypothetical protein